MDAGSLPPSVQVDNLTDTVYATWADVRYLGSTLAKKRPRSSYRLTTPLVGAASLWIPPARRR